jgi:hypothetical protein
MCQGLLNFTPSDSLGLQWFYQHRDQLRRSASNSAGLISLRLEVEIRVENGLQNGLKPDGKSGTDQR